MAGRVLVIDDEEHIRSIIEQALSDAGYKVVSVEHGAAALALMEKWEPDLILLDLWMPVMDGWQFVEAYRQAPGHHAPIVAMTAVVGDGGSPIEIAADAYLAKPFELDDLHEVVEQFTRPSQSSAKAVH